jgi:hypothetical protein
VEIPGKGHPKAIRLRDESSIRNRNTAVTKVATKQGVNGTDFGCSVSMRATEIDLSQTRENRGEREGFVSVDDSFFRPPLDEERI